jgi:hypothetical protein
MLRGRELAEVTKAVHWATISAARRGDDPWFVEAVASG